MTSARLSYILTLAILGQLLGCAEAAREARKHTYPPEFQYIEKQQIRSTMTEMAAAVRELNGVLRSHAGEIDRARVIELLELIKSSSSHVEVSGVKSNHPELAAHLGEFRQDVSSAIANVTANPPNYFLAGSIVGSCFYCHGPK
jgi:hypothetical protein